MTLKKYLPKSKIKLLLILLSIIAAPFVMWFTLSLIFASIFFHFPGTLIQMNELNQQINGPFIKSQNNEVGVTFEYPAKNWMYLPKQNAPQELASPKSKCIGAASLTSRFNFIICSNPDSDKVKKWLSEPSTPQRFGDNIYTRVRHNNDYVFGQILIAKDKKHWISFQYTYLSDNDLFISDLTEKLMLKVLDSVDFEELSN